MGQNIRREDVQDAVSLVRPRFATPPLGPHALSSIKECGAGKGSGDPHEAVTESRCFNTYAFRWEFRVNLGGTSRWCGR